MSKASNLFDLGGSDRESLEHSSDVSTRLHGDNTELVFFIDPDNESFVIIVENAATFWPLFDATSCIKVLIVSFEQKVIFDQLLLCCFVHT